MNQPEPVTPSPVSLTRLESKINDVEDNCRALINNLFDRVEFLEEVSRNLGEALQRVPTDPGSN